MAQRSIVIGGGAFAGLALALALRKALGPRFAVTLADPGLAGGQDPRASAIAAAPRRMFEALGVWAAVAGQAQEIVDMVITDLAVFQRPDHDSPFKLIERAPGVTAEEIASKTSAHYEE
jgi:2-polyprenyl-6-methoxyphenol hydroxylase-like FAD-dependent oxidoreductase